MDGEPISENKKVAKHGHTYILMSELCCTACCTICLEVFAGFCLDFASIREFISKAFSSSNLLTSSKAMVSPNTFALVQVSVEIKSTRRTSDNR